MIGRQEFGMYIIVLLFLRKAFSSTLKMEVVGSSETLVPVYETSERKILEDDNL
jgi:hypothetical protein